MENKLEKSKSQLELTLNQMQTYQKSKDYRKAQESKEQAEKLKAEISKLEIKVLKNRQTGDMASIKIMHSEEKTVFEAKWEAQLSEIKTEGQQMKTQLDRRQKEEAEGLENEHKQSWQRDQYRPTGPVIVLQRKEEALGKLENFIEAHEVQMQRLRMQEKEREAWKQQQQQNLKIQLKKLRTKHDNQWQALNKKIASKIQQAENQYSTSRKELQKKHANSLNEFSSSQKKENLTVTGKLKSSNTKSGGSTGLQRVKSANKMVSVLKQTPIECNTQNTPVSEMPQ